MQQSQFAIDGCEPGTVLAPESRDEVCRAVAAAEDEGWAIVPWGNGTHVHVGMPPRRYDVALRTSSLAGIVAHDPADMTLTVEAGMTLAALQAHLRPAGQWLPLDPPRPEAVTLGGLLAADLNGSLRFSHGKVRDYVIGIRAVVGGGVLVRGGGQVVKNVAGYDLMKLLIGSYGTLGVIVEATLKLRPLPAADLALAAPCESLELAVERTLALLDGPVAPYALDICNADAAVALGLPAQVHVLLRLGGETAEVREQRERLAGMLSGVVEIGAESSAAARDFAAGGSVSAKLSLLVGDLAAQLPSLEREAASFGLRLAVLAHAGSGIARIRLDGGADALPFLRWLRFLARQRGGHLIVERLPTHLKREVDVWGAPPAPPELLRQVKAALDPKSTFSPGRFAAGV